MPISVTCSCRRSMLIRDEMAGKKGKCPSCRTVLQIPAAKKNADAEEEIITVQPLHDDDGPPVKKKAVVEEEVSGYSLAKTPEKEKLRGGRGSRYEPEEEEEPEEHRPRRRPLVEEEDEPRPERSKRRRPKERLYPSEIEESRKGWFGNVHGGAAGGLLTMVIAVVWFVVGLNFDRIFLYPPVLFIIGLVAFIKGLTGGD